MYHKSPRLSRPPLPLDLEGLATPTVSPVVSPGVSPRHGGHKEHATFRIRTVVLCVVLLAVVALAGRGISGVSQDNGGFRTNSAASQRRLGLRSWTGESAILDHAGLRGVKVEGMKKGVLEEAGHAEIESADILSEEAALDGSEDVANDSEIILDTADRIPDRRLSTQQPSKPPLPLSQRMSQAGLKRYLEDDEIYFFSEGENKGKEQPDLKAGVGARRRARREKGRMVPRADHD